MKLVTVCCMVGALLLAACATLPPDPQISDFTPSPKASHVFDLWPGLAPGETADLGAEIDTTRPSDAVKAGKRVLRLSNVSRPTIRVFRPPSAKDTRAAVVVFPGGGYRILAMDIEGTEICRWLNSLGITGVLVKYRVPKREGLEKHTAALQDAQRAVRLVRHHAADWGIDSRRVGVIGFSAGGHLAACVGSIDARTYPAVDSADQQSSRPDFAMLLYPAYLTRKDEADKTAPELALTSNMAPTFVVMTQDDPLRIESVLSYSAALHQAQVSFELHVYPKGGHGYGLRQTGETVASWPTRAAEWMRSRGITAETRP